MERTILLATTLSVLNFFCPMLLRPKTVRKRTHPPVSLLFIIFITYRGEHFTKVYKYSTCAFLIGCYSKMFYDIDTYNL